MLLRRLTAAAFGFALLAQEPPKQTPPPAPPANPAPGNPAAQLPNAQTNAQEPKEPPPVFEYDGKPITLPYQCSLDDIHWSGMTCTADEPCAIYLELSSVEAVGDRVFAAGNIHSEAVTLYSVLLMSGDGGHSWQAAPDSVRGAGLDRIQFLDALTGWVDGQTLYPLPQDPFLMITTDGGKTWKLRPVFNDSHFGSIQQFGFDTKTNGSVIVDNGPGGDTERYARLETTDGGDTWAVKEESKKPLTLKRPPATPAWRVRADAATRSYKIEHRIGNQWTTAAAFSVKLPACQ